MSDKSLILQGNDLDRYISTGYDPLLDGAKSATSDTAPGCPSGAGGGEGSWRGPFSLMGELGNWFTLGKYEDGWQRNLGFVDKDRIAAVFACTTSYAQAIATMRMFHTRWLDNGGREYVTTSALSRILRNPNKYQTASDFRLNLVYALLYTGNAYAYAIRNARFEVESLHLIPSVGTTPYISPQTGEVYYALSDNPLIQTAGDIQALIPASEVLHIRLYTPQHPLIGVSPIRYAANALSINSAISTNQSGFFNNMSRPSGVITTDLQLKQEEMEKLSQMWDEKSRGLNAGKVPILGWGMKWNPMTITSQDAQLIEVYKMTIEDIARVFRVPLALIGHYEKATYNNTETLINSWLSTGLGFMMQHIEASFTKFFNLAADEAVDFDDQALLRMDFEARVKGLTNGINNGLYAIDEARSEIGLPAAPGGFGKEPRVQAQFVPLSQVAVNGGQPAESAPSTPSAPAAPVKPEDDNTDDSKSIPLEDQAALAKLELKRLLAA